MAKSRRVDLRLRFCAAFLLICAFRDLVIIQLPLSYRVSFLEQEATAGRGKSRRGACQAPCGPVW
jgi:hypothetical protein